MRWTGVVGVVGICFAGAGATYLYEQRTTLTVDQRLSDASSVSTHEVEPTFALRVGSRATFGYQFLLDLDAPTESEHWVGVLLPLWQDAPR